MVHSLSVNLDLNSFQLSDANDAELACLPFAFVESWGIGCAYERSIKLSNHGVFANRYLLAFATNAVPASRLMDACESMGFPLSARSAFLKRHARSLTTFLGYEQSRDSTLLKVYLGFEPRHGRGVLSHIGWKWNPREARGDGSNDRYRVTLYRRRGYQTDEVLSNLYQSFSTFSNSLYHPNPKHKRGINEAYRPSNSSPSSMQTLISKILTTAFTLTNTLYLNEVSESGGRRSYDWNLYPTGLTVGHFATELTGALSDCGCTTKESKQFLDLDSQGLLGHIAYGRDWNENDFCTLYYSPTQESNGVAS